MTTDLLRTVTVDAYLDAIRARALGSGDIALLAPVPGSPGAYEPATEEQWERFDRAQWQRHPGREVLPRVAAEYRRALRSPDPKVARAPTAAVAKELNYSRGHASRMVSQARAAGLLSESRGRGKPGERVEQEPTTAMARRATKRGRR